MTPVNVFVSSARAMLGTPWRHRGRKPWGVDCIGLVVLAAQAAGVEVVDPKYYGREPWEDRLRQGLRQHCGVPVTDAWREGDIALINWREGDPSHVGIIANYKYGGLSIIHANNLFGVVEHPLTGPFIQAVVEVYRLWPVKSSQ